MRISVLVFIIFLFSFSAIANEENEMSGCSEVVVSKIKIVCLKKGIGSFSASERAESIRHRIENLARDLTFDPASITVAPLEGAVNVSAGESIIISLQAGDLGLENLEERTATGSQLFPADRKFCT
jgi:hypothetical protein